MREIKFRTYYKNEMYNLTAFYPWSNGDSKICRIEIKGTDTPIKFTNLMQYTGLKDKTGKLIFEGDIVNILADIKDEILCFEVKISPNGVLLEIPKEYGFLNNKLFEINSEKLEIIGNIYENKNLLDNK